MTGAGLVRGVSEGIGVSGITHTPFNNQLKYTLTHNESGCSPGQLAEAHDSLVGQVADVDLHTGTRFRQTVHKPVNNTTGLLLWRGCLCE